MYNIDLSAREGFRNEESDTLFSLDGLDPRFRRFGERLAAWGATFGEVPPPD